MGKFYYDNAESVEIDDRALAHLKIVMLAKLRRHEGFPFSFEYEVASGGGRTTLWVHPSSHLQFRFEGGRQPAINKAWLDLLMNAANAIDGLRILPEPEDYGENVGTTTQAIPVQR